MEKFVINLKREEKLGNVYSYFNISDVLYRVFRNFKWNYKYLKIVA